MLRSGNTRFYIGFMILLIGIFCIYNSYIYSDNNNQYTAVLTAKATAGQTLWQQNNCSSCHQLYGLGGYLGPDLTNIFSNKRTGPAFIKIVLHSGIKSMPGFNFSDKDKECLVAFLKEVDQSGYYPNYNAKTQLNGWVEIQCKNEK